MSPKTDLRTGGCLCGVVRYEINLANSETGNCHCRYCQKNSGAPFMTCTNLDRGQFRWISEPTGEARASDIAVRRFCRQCGTPLVWESEEELDTVSVNAGTLDDPGGLDIVYEIYTRSRWAAIPPVPGARQYEGGA